MAKPTSYWSIILMVGWVSVIGITATTLLRFTGTAGASGTVQVQWPAGSSLAASREHPTLVTFLHPHCPCSRATVANLARLAARLAKRIQIEAVLVAPPGVEDSWVQGSLGEAVQGIPGVTMHIDQNGRLARLFGAATSGQVYLYDAGGTCVFAGGITPLRGHEGDNPGTDAIVSQVLIGKSDVAAWPVTGCPLFDYADNGSTDPSSEDAGT